VGGGPAGMEAALVASWRGHEVTLLEKEAQCGGNLSVACAPDFKDDMKRYRDYLVHKIAKSDVMLTTRSAAERGFVGVYKPDALVLAVGAEPVWPDIPGVRPDSCLWAGDVFTGKAETGDRVVVVGDGGVACEAALVLARQGKQVAIIELPGGSAQDQTVNFVDMSMLLELLDEHGVRVRKGVVLQSVASGGVRTVDGAGAAGELAADTVVLALDLRPRFEVIDQLKDLAPEVYVVGDCKAPRALFAAVHEGFEAALEI
jgi:NADPH-dependent 2,4-dienoyl-CoA reductase/sulfur reductase-like enzyme